MNEKRFIQNGIIKKERNGYIKIQIGIMWVDEHRAIAEEILGRLLNKTEVIHHIDFNKKNNSPNNLALFENQKAHSHWHSQFNQFGWTQPLTKIILENKITNKKVITTK